jgi:hypothetical protein
MKRLVALAALALAGCSSGSPVVPAGFRGPVAIAPFIGMNPDRPASGLVPLLAVASIRGNELRLLDPSDDTPVAAANPAWALAVPTLQHPSLLGSGSLHDGLADLLVIAGSGTEAQLVGTWLDGTKGFGVVVTWDIASPALGGLVGAGAQILSLAVTAVPSGPAVGTPPVAPPTPGRAWIVLGFSDPQDLAAGRLVVIEVARQADGSIAMASPPVAKPLGFSPGSLAAAPDNVHLYAASLDVIRDSSGRNVLGVAEIDVSGGLSAPWPVRAFDARNAPTVAVAAAFVGERTQENFYTYAAPALRVYATLDASGCGPERDITCGVATFDPATGALATDPAVPGPLKWGVPTQSYRTPMVQPALPIAMGIAMPAANPGTDAPSTPFGSQVCFSPAQAGVLLPLCPTVTEEAGSPPFNGSGAPQKFMLQAPASGQLWTSVVAMVSTIDGFVYVQDLGRFGPVNAVSMLQDETTRTKALNATSVGPAGPIGNSPFLGFPDGTAALGLWMDPTSGTGEVVYKSTDLPGAVTVWPGFTRDDHWLVSYQGVLPGLAQRRAVLGQGADGALYLAVQEAAVPPVDGVLSASGYWVPGAIVASPELGIHTLEKNGPPGDIGQFLLDEDPCPSTRPNWIPASETVPVYDPTKPPLAHEAVVRSLLAPDAALYPGGALRLLPEADTVLAEEYACLAAWFQRPGNAGKVLTALGTVPSSGGYARGAWVRAGELVLTGTSTGYAGRPTMDVLYALAWEDETGLSGEALVLARKGRRFYYPSAYPIRSYTGFPGMTDPMATGPVVGFRVGRYCLATVPDCNAGTSPPARDAGVDFYTQAGLTIMSRHPSSTAGGNFLTSFDKSVFPGQEYRGTVFYGSFTGDLLMMIPPGLDVGQSISIR